MAGSILPNSSSTGHARSRWTVFMKFSRGVVCFSPNRSKAPANSGEDTMWDETKWNRIHIMNVKEYLEEVVDMDTNPDNLLCLWCGLVSALLFLVQASSSSDRLWLLNELTNRATNQGTSAIKSNAKTPKPACSLLLYWKHFPFLKGEGRYVSDI